MDILETVNVCCILIAITVPFDFQIHVVSCLPVLEYKKCFIYLEEKEAVYGYNKKKM